MQDYKRLQLYRRAALRAAVTHVSKLIERVGLKRKEAKAQRMQKLAGFLWYGCAWPYGSKVVLVLVAARFATVLQNALSGAGWETSSFQLSNL